MTCAQCGAEPLPHTRLCWTCGDESAAVQMSFRLEVTEVEAQHHERVAQLIAALVDEPTDAVRAVVAHPPFTIAATLPTEQSDRLASWLADLGVRRRAAGAGIGEPEWRFMLSPDWSSLAKLFIAGAAGITASALAVPVVPWAAAATAALVGARVIAVRPTTLAIREANAAQRLAVLDRDLAEDVVRVRRSLTDRAVIEVAGRCLAEYVELMSMVRAEGAHLERGAMQTTDRRLQQLLRGALKLITVANGCAGAAASASLPSERAAQVRKLRGDLIGHLDALTAALAAARAQVLGVSQAEARALLGKSIGGVGALLSRLEGELEVAELMAKTS